MKILPITWILSCLLFGIFIELDGQRIPYSTNVSISVDQNRTVIHYKIKTKNPKDPHRIALQFLDESFNLIRPTMLSGDIGPVIPGFKDKTIIWDITNDMQLLGSKVTPVLFVNGKSKQFSNTGGPGNAWLSLLVPGLGDYFVADRKIMTFKPYMRTTSSLGLIGLGFYAGSQRIPTVELRRFVKSNPQNFEGDDRYYYKEFEGDPINCWFKWDKEVLLIAGATIWVADILWVLARGTNNDKFLKSFSGGSDFSLGYLPGGASLQYAYTF